MGTISGGIPFGHAGYITLIALIFQNALAFALALACDREIRMKRFYRLVSLSRRCFLKVVVRPYLELDLEP